MDVREAVAPPLVFEREFFVIDAEGVEKRGLEIVHVNGIFDDVVAELVGGTVAHAALETAASDPACEAARVVVAPVVGGSKFALRIVGPAEFATPDDERVV